MRARLREEIIITMSVEEARQLRQEITNEIETVSFLTLGRTLDSVLGNDEVDHTQLTE